MLRRPETSSWWSWCCHGRTAWRSPMRERRPSMKTFQKQDWKARCLLVEVGCTSFAGQSLYKNLSAQELKGEEASKTTQGKYRKQDGEEVHGESQLPSTPNWSEQPKLGRRREHACWKTWNNWRPQVISLMMCSGASKRCGLSNMYHYYYYDFVFFSFGPFNHSFHLHLSSASSLTPTNYMFSSTTYLNLNLNFWYLCSCVVVHREHTSSTDVLPAEVKVQKMTLMRKKKSILFAFSVSCLKRNTTWLYWLKCNNRTLLIITDTNL